MPFDVAGALGAGYSSNEIIEHLKAHPEDVDGFRIDDALKAGYSPDEIVDHLKPKADKINVQGIPILAPIDRGIAHLREQGANLAQDLGATGIASGIRQSIPQATLHAKTAGERLSEDLGSRDYLSALSNLPSAALEQAAPLAGSLVAGAASGGSVPAILGTGAAIGAVTQGDAIARQRAANNGRTDGPSAGDLALGITGGAATGAVGSVGLGGIAGRGIGAGLRATVLHGAADAAQPEMVSLAGSVGTDAGAQNASGPDTAAAALTGLATRGALAAPGVVRDKTPAGKQASLADRFNALSPEAQARTTNTAAAGDLLNSVRDDAVPLLGKPTHPALARTAGSLLDSRILGLAGKLDSEGLITAHDRAAIDDAHTAASRPDLALLNSHLSAIDDIGLDPATARTLKNSITQRAMLTGAGVDPETSMMGDALGLGGRMVRGAVHSLLPSPISHVANLAVRPIVDSIAGRLGLGDPALVKAASKATEMLQAAGHPVPDTLGSLAKAMASQQDVVKAQARLMGLDASRVTPGTEEGSVADFNSKVPTLPPAAAVAAARAARAPGAPQSLTAPMPGLDGVSQAARAQGQLLPEWQYGLGANLVDALNARGTPKNINVAQEVSKAVEAMRDRGWFDGDFSNALMAHDGRVTRGLYNVIRNEMMGNHGIDMRTLAAQSA